MNMTFFLSVFSVLSLIYLAVGVYASQTVETNDDYFLAGRSLGLWSLSFTLIATQLGGGLLIGCSDQAYVTGYYGLYYSAGMALGFLILGLGLASKLREFNVATIPQLFETRYGSKALRKVASIFSALSLCGVTAALVVSSRGLLLGLGIGSELVNVAFWGIVIAYTMIGGLRAVVMTDVLQVFIILGIFTTVFIVSLLGEPASFFSLSSLAAQQSFFASGSMNFTGYFLMPVFFSLVEQDLAQRFFAAKSKRIAVLASLIAGAGIMVFTMIPVYFGMKARFMGLAVPAGASPLIIVLKAMTNEFVIAFVVCAILAAVISTADSLLCATGSLLAQDFDVTFSSNQGQLYFSQATVLVTGLFAMMVGYFGTDVLAVMTQSYELPISCLLVSILWCFVRPGKLNGTAAQYSILAGLIGFFLFRMWAPPFVPREIATLMLSLVGFWLGNCLFDKGAENEYPELQSDMK